MRSTYFDKGCEHYHRKEYDKAIEYFQLSIAKEFNRAGNAWLGQCYEYGLGTEKDLAEAKDLYQTALIRLCGSPGSSLGSSNGSSRTQQELVLWLEQRLEKLKNIPTSDEQNRFIQELGNIKVRKTSIASGNPTIRYNTNCTVITIHKIEPFCTGFLHAKETLPQLNKEWTCDGLNRFHDGYTLNTDLFSLTVKRGTGNTYRATTELATTTQASHCSSGSPGSSSSPGSSGSSGSSGRYICTVHFPKDANLEYIYVQESILKKVHDLLFQIAQEILPAKLKEISDKIGTTYEKCIVERRGHGNYSACNYAKGKLIEMRSTCIQLPIESLEALCVHELTHNFITPHNTEFYNKMEELGNKLEIGGQAICELYHNLFNEGRWRYLIF